MEKVRESIGTQAQPEQQKQVRLSSPVRKYYNEILIPLHVITPLSLPSFSISISRHTADTLLANLLQMRGMSSKCYSSNYYAEHGNSPENATETLF